MGPIRIDRCVCYNQSFSKLKKLAEKHNCTSVEELQEHVDFGMNCRLCHPYVKIMLKTGQTVFDHVISE